MINWPPSKWLTKGDCLGNSQGSCLAKCPQMLQWNTNHTDESLVCLEFHHGVCITKPHFASSQQPLMETYWAPICNEHCFLLYYKWAMVIWGQDSFLFLFLASRCHLWSDLKIVTFRDSCFNQCTVTIFIPWTSLYFPQPGT